jgi:hypothetical protein
VLAAAVLGCSPGTAYRDVVQKVSDRPTGEITRGLSVTQTFVSNHRHLSGVALQIATWARKNQCGVNIRIRREGSNTDIALEHFKCSEIIDNAWIEVDFPPVDDSLDQRFAITVESPDGAPGNAVSLWTIPTRVYADGQLFINGTPMPGAITFMTYHR